MDLYKVLGMAKLNPIDYKKAKRVFTPFGYELYLANDKIFLGFRYGDDILLIEIKEPYIFNTHKIYNPEELESEIAEDRVFGILVNSGKSEPIYFSSIKNFKPKRVFRDF